jgi:hypothetical protein
MPERKQYSLVYVEWVDSTSPKGWDNLANRPDKFGMACVSVGYKTHETRDMIELCPHLSSQRDNGYQADGVFRIPKCAIKKQRRIKGCPIPAQLINGE